MKRVLITGTSRGIGRATAQALHDRGWSVVGTLRRPREAPWSTPLVDVTDGPGLARVVDEHGPFDAVVANAGAGLFGAFEDCTAEQVERLFRVNVLGAMETVRQALPGLRERRGRVVLIGSVAGRRSAPGSSVYNATKFALEGWAEGLRHELRPLGVAVCIVEPGPTESGFFASRAEGAGVGRGPYAPMSARLRELQSELLGRRVPAEVVVQAVLRALEDSDPPLRLPTGRSTRLELLAARLLPWRIYEALVGAKLKLPRGH